MSSLSEIRAMPTVIAALPGDRPVHESVLRSHGILQWLKRQLQDAAGQADKQDRCTIEINPFVLLEVVELLEQRDEVVSLPTEGGMTRLISLRSLIVAQRELERFRQRIGAMPLSQDDLDLVENVQTFLVKALENPKP